jgi:hypothetical protein
MRAVSVTEFAKERHVSRARVYQWIGDGRVERLEDGSIDADAAHAKLGATLDQAKGIRRDGNVTSQGPASPGASSAAANGERPIQMSGSGNGSPAGDLLGGQRDEGDARGPGTERSGKPESVGRDDTGYWESKARREAAEAQMAEMRAMQAAGALVPAAGVRKELAALARATRNAMLSIPDRVSPVLDPANPARAHKLLTDEIGKALRELSARLERERAAADPEAAEPERALQ